MFIPSRREGFFSGGVDGNDNLYCRYNVENGNNRINVYTRLQEQRQTALTTGQIRLGLSNLKEYHATV